MKTLAIIPARAGSRGVPQKNVRELLGKPVISYTIEAALAARQISSIAVTSDDEDVLAICEQYNVQQVQRPYHLATDTARIDDVMRHCCQDICTQNHMDPANGFDIVVLLYANIPVRSESIIDRTIEKLIATGADSVQTLSPVGKFHPYWLYRLEDDKASVYIENQADRRQLLPPLYCVDGAVGATRYDCLRDSAESEHPHDFWGADRRAIIQEAYETVDIDSLRDFYLAEAALRERQALAVTV